MKRRNRFLLAGLASAGAVAGAGLLYNRRPHPTEWLYVTVFSEPGYLGRNETLSWTGGEREIVPLDQIQLPRIGSIRLERRVYRFQPDVRPPNVFILWHAITERADPTDPEEGLSSFIAMNQLAGMFSLGQWESVRESEARSGVRLWAERPGQAIAPGAAPSHDVLANTADLGSWSTRTRYLELGYHS
ncbi:hypothetical protein ACFUN8_07570 [Streptomyces sp. NPDC057307]|uniref:hypothetical protein n=1 Tax=Streptomyces sp. NPDC057307 TaxID=3346096 RepID=UPI003645C4E4